MLDIDDLIGGAIADSSFGSLGRLVGRLLKGLFLFIVSPYLLLRGWLPGRPRAAGVWELYQQGRQAAAHDMQYVLAGVVALPLAALCGWGLWQAGHEILALLR